MRCWVGGSVVVEGGGMACQREALSFSLPVSTELNHWTLRERKCELRVQEGYKRRINALFH